MIHEFTLVTGHSALAYAPGIPAVGFLIWTAWTLAALYFAMKLVERIGPTAAGSGIPEMKTILSGVTLNRSLSFYTLVTKVTGLTVLIGSGMQNSACGIVMVMV